MAILVLTSTCCSPGVTSLAVGLALAWPRAVLLADCDPGAHQSVLAGYLGGQSPSGKGLLRVAEAHRDGRGLRDVILDQTMPLTGDRSASRLFLPGFTTSGSAALFSGVWSDLVEAFGRLDDTEMDVIVDAGRIVGQRPTPLVQSAALTCLVMRSNLRSVLSARVHGAAVRGHQDWIAAEAPTGLLLVGEGQPYGKQEIAKALAMPVLASIAFDPAAARHLSEGAPRPRKFESTGLAKSLHTTAVVLSGQMQQSADRIRS